VDLFVQQTTSRPRHLCLWDERLSGIHALPPFNWIGPRLDSLDTAKEGSSRVVTQFIAELLMQRPISLVDGGHQKRCFTYVDDGIDALLSILRIVIASVPMRS